MGDEIFIVRVTGKHTSKRRWFVDKSWADDFFCDAFNNAGPGHVVELIQMSMDYLIDHALDELLDGPFTSEEADEDAEYTVLVRETT